VILIARHALRESLRRRTFAVVIGLSIAFGALYAFGTHELFKDVSGFGGDESGIDAKTLAGATILGLAMFGSLFLGAVLAVFLTAGAVRGDAESGTLQPLIVRPLSRRRYLAGRLLAASVVSAGYVAFAYIGAVLITGAIGGWWPDRIVTPAFELAGAVAIVTAISLLGSVFLSATANGIAVFMVFGAGLTAGLLGQVGEAIGSDTLQDVSRIATWVLPFEALYQDALSSITADTVGFTRLAIDLGPFGGAQSAGPGLLVWAAAFTVAVGLMALAGFARKDL
jgi:ABC-type transport system involved in multi-copper enzyme maturation permease subunit